MAVCFEAKIISVKSEAGIVSVSIANDAHEPSKYVILSRCLELSEQDSELGHHQVYSEVSDQRCSGYGLLKAAMLDSSRLTLKFCDPSQDVVVHLAGAAFDPVVLYGGLTLLAEGSVIGVSRT